MRNICDFSRLWTVSEAVAQTAENTSSGKRRLTEYFVPPLNSQYPPQAFEVQIAPQKVSILTR